VFRGRNLWNTKQGLRKVSQYRDKATGWTNAVQFQAEANDLPLRHRV